MKNYLISFLQKLIGYERYLFIFAKLKIRLLKYNKKKSTFLYFENLVGEDATIAVVGASVGITTIPFVNEHRRIFAYEPIPSNYSVLQKLKKSYKAEKLSLFQIALGNSSGEVEMVFPKINGAKKHGLSYVKGVSGADDLNGEQLTINIDKLDLRLELKELKLDALKVVAENYEFEIFSGAKGIIDRNSPIIYCELWPNSNRSIVLELIKSMNYMVFIVIGGVLETYEDHQKTYTGKHFIFLPR